MDNNTQQTGPSPLQLKHEEQLQLAANNGDKRAQAELMEMARNNQLKIQQGSNSGPGAPYQTAPVNSNYGAHQQPENSFEGVVSRQDPYNKYRDISGDQGGA